MPNHFNRREFLKTAGCLSLALGANPVFALPDSVARPSHAPAALHPPSSVALVPDFNPRDFLQPEAVLWPGYFWLWNAPVTPDLWRAQLADMAAHDAKSVCLLPMPHAFRPDSTNNSLDPDYLTPEYFERVREAVEEAARLGMAWWLYDEGGWPSGQALGKVIQDYPQLTRRSITRERAPSDEPFLVPADALALVVDGPGAKHIPPGERWTPTRSDQTAWLYRISSSGSVDLLNPDATARFINLTHDAYARALSQHFGKTVKFTFTDEPSAGMPQPPKSIPWFPGLPSAYEALSGRSFFSDLPHFFLEPGPDMPLEAARARVALYDVVAARFAEAYFTPLKQWGRPHGLASGGHLGGEDETFGAVKYGFGHLTRQLRCLDVPGVDLIWRQLFPGRDGQSNFPVAAASAAHQNGTRFAFSESFCVYGNGLTPAQMKWLTDYQYLRGINLLVLGCYPLSTRDHHMTGERPHFGPVNPLWDHLPGYHAYVARLGYTLSVGQPLLNTALYYPSRDLWAMGLTAKDAVDSYEAVGLELMARQCPFDLIDDDMLSTATLRGKSLTVGAMHYDTIVCGSVNWMHPQAHQRLAAFAAAGGKVLCVYQPPACDGMGSTPSAASFRTGTALEAAVWAGPLITLSPPSRGLRVVGRQLSRQRLLVLFNEGQQPYQGSISTAGDTVSELDLVTGTITTEPVKAPDLRFSLDPGETKAFRLSRGRPRFTRNALVTQDSITIDPAQIHAVSGKQFVVGEHDFETRTRTFERVPLAQSAVWKTWLGEDYSGEVDYQFDFQVPESWRGSALRLDTGPIEYAATVYLGGTKAGYLLWPPWRILLPACHPGPHTITIRVANTLANELTSARVGQDWSQKKGPGWPSPYHARALQFEKESRGGGFSAPILLTRIVPH